jgi:hypothetical protein
MEDAVTTIAGEPLDVLEEAFELFELEVEPCGCMSMTGRLPEHLSDAMRRALVEIEVEMFEHGVFPYSGPGTDPFDELWDRVIAARTHE